MAGQLTLGGAAFGTAGGGWIFGPNTVSGTKSKPELTNIELEAGVELKVKLPPEAVAWAIGFEFVSGPPTVTIKTNVAGDGVMSCPAQGFFSKMVATGETELAFKCASAPKVFQLAVI